MAKILTREDILKKQYSYLAKMNQRIRYVSEAYYLSEDGVVYSKSLVPFLEKIIKLEDPENLSEFYGALVMPNAFFDFTKNAKKTKLTIEEKKKDNFIEQIIFGQIDNQDLRYTLAFANTTKDDIKNTMYKRMFLVHEDPNVIKYDNFGYYSDFPEEMTKKIVNSEAVYYEYNGTTLTFTKHLFLDIKKTDQISITRLGYEAMGKETYRVFYMIRQITDLYTEYTLFNTLQGHINSPSDTI